MKLILTRHCETDWNAEGRFQGHTDRLLNERGRAQAGMLAEALREQGITRIVSSPLRRAAETAEIIAKKLGVSIHFDERLQEICFGSIEGLTWPEAEKRVGKPRLEIEKEWNFRPYGGENAEDLDARTLSFIRDLEQLHGRDTCLIVGHGSSFWGLQNSLGIPKELERGEYRVIEYKSDRARELAFWRPSEA